LDKLQELAAAKAAEEKFNQRMSQFDNEYELGDEDRKVIATDIKEVDDEAFSAYWDKMIVLLSGKNKKVLAKVEKDTEGVKEEKAEASSGAEEVIEEVMENAEQEAAEMPTSSEAVEPTVTDKYRNAFALEQFDIKI
jgi:hypothetical protein